jgi:hypothetical protein
MPEVRQPEGEPATGLILRGDLQEKLMGSRTFQPIANTGSSVGFLYKAFFETGCTQMGQCYNTPSPHPSPSEGRGMGEGAISFICVHLRGSCSNLWFLSAMIHG